MGRRTGRRNRSRLCLAWLEDATNKVVRAGFFEGADHKIMFEGNGPLANFSHRIEYCYLSGRISTVERRALNLIRKIRNDFAHVSALQATFDQQEIAQRCANLKELSIHPKSFQISTNRALFCVVAVIFFIMLNNNRAKNIGKPAKLTELPFEIGES